MCSDILAELLTWFLPLLLLLCFSMLPLRPFVTALSSVHTELASRMGRYSMEQCKLYYNNIRYSTGWHRKHKTAQYSPVVFPSVHSIVQHSIAQCSDAQDNRIQYSAEQKYCIELPIVAQHDREQYTAQHSTGQYSTVQDSIAQWSLTLYSPVQPRPYTGCTVLYWDVLYSAAQYSIEQLSTTWYMT